MTKKPRSPGSKADATPRKAPRKARRGKGGTRTALAAVAAPEATDGRRSRAGTKQDAPIAMLRRPDGVTVEEVGRALGWQSHTVRGALYGALKKKLGLKIESKKIEGRGRVYRIAD